MDGTQPKTAESSIHALNKDCLEQLFSRCSPRDVLQLRQTCKTNSTLLNESVVIWQNLLASQYGLTIKSAQPLIEFARYIYEAKSDTSIRFQGVFTNGGVDEDAMQYWVDNMFRVDRTPYCSNMSINADSIALLLDGEVPRDAEYDLRRRYIMRRCRYAAALMEILNNPGEILQDPNQMMNIVENWSPQRLELFFMDLVVALHNDNALGRLLVFDVPHNALAEERQRIDSVYHYLQNRPARMLRSMVKAPEDANTIFDTSVMEKLQNSNSGGGGGNNNNNNNNSVQQRCVGIVHEINLCRSGSLTCPAQTGIVYVGKIDTAQFQGKTQQEMVKELQQATQHPICVVSNSMASVEEVELAVARGDLPCIVDRGLTTAGKWVEFSLEHSPPSVLDEEEVDVVGGEEQPQLKDNIDGAGTSSGGGGGGRQQQAPVGSVASRTRGSSSKNKQQQPLVVWQPLVWFRFNTRQEAAHMVAAAAENEEQPQLQPVDDEAEQQQEQLHAASAPIAAPPAPLPPPPPPQQQQQPPAAAPPANNNGNNGNDQEQEEDEFVMLALGSASDSEEVDMDALLHLAGAGGDSDSDTDNSDMNDDDGGGEEEGMEGQDWSDSDIEDLEQGQAMVMAPGGGLDDEEMSEEEDEPDRSAGRNLLNIKLKTPVAVNALLVKLINQENLMEEFHDNHSFPNIDMTYVECIGKLIELPAHVSLVVEKQA